MHSQAIEGWVNWILGIIVIAGIFSCTQPDEANGQSTPPAPIVDDTQTKVSERWLDSDTRYQIGNGHSLRIQNSYPRGGAYLSTDSESFGFGIFWTRLINDIEIPVEIDLVFPRDPLPIPSVKGAQYRLFLPADTMTLQNQHEINYGVDDLTALFEHTPLSPPTLKGTVAPGEEYMFYTAMLFQLPDNGPVRTGIDIRNDSVFYRVSIDGRLDTTYTYCGQIEFKQ